MARPSKRDAIDDRLRDIGGLDTFIGKARADGKSWRTIALEIWDQAGIRVSDVTVQQWAEGYEEEREQAKKTKTRTKTAKAG